MLKQYIVLPRKPRMSPGKLVSQGVHASFMALHSPNEDNSIRIEDWKNSGQCVIVCQVYDTATLLGLKAYCEQWKVPHHLYVDEGYTEVECGTPTAFATGIIEEKDQWMFAELELFR